MLEGILPTNLLFDKFNLLKNVKLDKLGGISPKSWFTEKSIDFCDLIIPILSGILPIKILNDKFNDYNPWILVTSLGISPEKLFFERSILFTSPRMVPHSTTRPFITSNALSNCSCFAYPIEKPYE